MYSNKVMTNKQSIDNTRTTRTRPAHLVILIVIIITRSKCNANNASIDRTSNDNSTHISRGNYGGPEEWGSEVTAGLTAFYSQLFTSSNPHADRCSKPLPWDPLSSPYTLANKTSVLRESIFFVIIDNNDDSNDTTTTTTTPNNDNNSDDNHNTYYYYYYYLKHSKSASRSVVKKNR